MRDWVVGGAIIQAGSLTEARDRPDGDVLLVENLRRNGTSDWTPPGGVIDSGEDLRSGLTREVREETGLDVVRWDGPVYEIVAEAPALDWRLRVEVHRAAEVHGRLRVGADPDGIVVAADWVDGAACRDRLCDAHPWVREPLVEWIEHRFATLRTFRYRVLGDSISDLTVERW